MKRNQTATEFTHAWLNNRPVFKDSQGNITGIGRSIKQIAGKKKILNYGTFIHAINPSSLEADVALLNMTRA